MSFLRKIKRGIVWLGKLFVRACKWLWSKLFIILTIPIVAIGYCLTENIEFTAEKLDFNLDEKEGYFPLITTIWIGVAGAVTAVLTMWRHSSIDKQVKEIAAQTKIQSQQTKVQNETRLDQQFLDAVKLLGDESSNYSAKQGAVYMLSALAQQSPEHTQRCTDMLVSLNEWMGVRLKNEPYYFRREAKIGENNFVIWRERIFSSDAEGLSDYAKSIREEKDENQDDELKKAFDQEEIKTLIAQQDAERLSQAILGELEKIINHYLKQDPQNQEQLKLDGRYVCQINLSNKEIENRISFKRCNLEGADLRFAFLRSAHLEGASLYKTYLEGADLNDAHLEGANLSKAHLARADLSYAHLKGVILSTAHMEGAHLSKAHLVRADLSYAHLEGANLNKAHLVRADLSYAHLEGANLSKAHLVGADLSHAHLEGADLSKAHLEGAFLYYVQLEGADLSHAQLEGANLSKAHLEGSRIIDAHLEGATISYGHLEGAYSRDYDFDNFEDQINNRIDKEADLETTYLSELSQQRASEIINVLNSMPYTYSQNDPISRIRNAIGKPTNLEGAHFGSYNAEDAKKMIAKYEAAMLRKKYFR